MKKVLSIILSFIMILSVVPITASAETYSGTCGENLTWTFDDSTGTLTISGTGAMCNYDSYHSIPWGDFRQEIEKVVVDDGVTTIGDYAFNNCYNLKSVVIPDNVTIIGHFAFFECRGISILMLPDGVTTIGIYAFAECRSLKAIAIPDSVTSISRSAFEWSTNLTDVYYSGTEEDWNNILIDSDNDSLLNAIIHFEGYNDGVISGICGENLTWTFNFSSGTLTISGTGAMYDYEYNDESCSYNHPWEGYENNINEVVIGNDVTTIGEGAFFACTSLESVIIGNSATTINSYAFAYCDSLVSVTLPNSVTTIGEGAFCGCVNLISVTLPNSVTTIAEGVFYDCSSLTSVTIPDSVTTIDYCAFDGCTNLTDVYYSGTEKEWNKITIEEYNDPLINATIDFKTCEHIFSDWIVEMPQTCTENGLEKRVCSECSKTEEREIPATGHADKDKDGYCDVCDELLCDHDCHRGGFAGFFWKIANFFNRLFGSNKYCECGVAHY